MKRTRTSACATRYQRGRLKELSGFVGLRADFDAGPFIDPVIRGLKGFAGVAIRFLVGGIFCSGEAAMEG